MKWLRLVVGPQPVLRLIAVLLAVIAALLYLVYEKLDAMHYDMPSDPCGSSTYEPCQVEIMKRY